MRKGEEFKAPRYASAAAIRNYITTYNIIPNNNNYLLFTNLKAFIYNNFLQLCYWKEFKYLYNYLKIFYKATLIIKGNYIGFTDHF